MLSRVFGPKPFNWYHVTDGHNFDRGMWPSAGGKCDQTPVVTPCVHGHIFLLPGHKTLYRSRSWLVSWFAAVCIGNGIILDGETQECMSLDGGTLLNDKVQDNPQYLAPRDSTIIWAGKVTRLVVMWWCGDAELAVSLSEITWVKLSPVIQFFSSRWERQTLWKGALGRGIGKWDV